MSDPAASDAGTAPVRRPPWRNPWLWGALIGMLVVTLLRPVLRHVPEPPPVTGRLPAVALEVASPDGSVGGVFDVASSGGAVHVLAVLEAPCELACARLVEDLAALSLRFAEVDADARVAVVAVGEPAAVLRAGREAGADPDRWIVLGGEREERCRLVAGAFGQALGGREPDCARLDEVAHAARLVLVDPTGRLRGTYGADRMGLDEVFHRSLHVLAEGRSAAAAAPGAE